MSVEPRIFLPPNLMPMPQRSFATISFALIAFALFFVAEGRADPRASGETYRRAWDGVVITPEQFDAVAVEPYQLPPAPALRAAVEANVEPLRLFAEAAGAESVDFGVDYAKGYDAVIDLLNPARQIALLDAGAAAVAADAGRPADAADCVADLFRFARHLGNEPTVVTKLVQTGIEKLGVEAAQSVLPRLDAAATARLRDALAHLPKDQSFADAVRGDARVGANYFASLAQFPRDKFMDLQTGKYLDLTPEQHAAWADPATRRRWADGVVRQGNDTAAALALPPEERRAKLAALHAARADYGPLAELTSSDLNTYLDLRQAHIVRVALLRAALDVLVLGDGSKTKILDPTDDKPFEFHERDDGELELISRYVVDDEPLRLRFRPATPVVGR